MTRNPRSAAPTFVAGATVVLGLITVGIAVTTAGSPQELIAENRANQWLGGLAFGLVGALVLKAQPGNRLGMAMAASGITASLGSSAAEYAMLAQEHPTSHFGLGLAAWAASTLWLPAFLVILAALPLLFPDGTLPGQRWRVPGWCALIAGVLAVVGVSTTQAILDDGGYPDVHNRLDLPIDDDAQLVAVLFCFAVVAVVGAAAALGIIWRMRDADRDRRLQGAWFVAAILLGGFGSLLPAPDVVQFLLSACSVVCLAVGVVRHRLFAIDVVLSRAVVYALLTIAALAGYLAVAALLGASTDAGVLPAVVAAGLALLLASGRQRLQGWVDRAMYGQRRDPVAALTGLGERLSTAVDDDEVLPAIIDGVRSALNLPYAEVRFEREASPASFSGEIPQQTATFDLVHAGEQVGVLVVGLRRGESQLSAADVRLLEAFARQVGVAAHGLRATRELRRSRERVVLSREEERRRLRRELHDGLGPTLAGISLGLEKAAKVVSRDAGETLVLLGELKADAIACVDEVRRIVADLRPPALDQSGLAEALRRHTELLTSRSNGALAVTLEEAGLPDLPPAVEVAAYRIATEALTNIVRHSSASTCRVGLAPGPDGGRPTLRLTVCDDGTGAPPAATGNGLHTMRERAEELGGTCTVTFRPGRGTQVEALLPTMAGVSQ